MHLLNYNITKGNKMTVFEKLNAINANNHTEQKNGLTYLSWAWAWAEVKKLYPEAQYTVYENAEGWNYHHDGRTAWVKTGVTIEGLEHIEYLPVMDFKNKSIKLEQVTSFDVNKAIQRSLTKALARHGLGLYIYAGEDLPEGETKQEPQKPNMSMDLPDEEIQRLRSIMFSNEPKDENTKPHFEVLTKYVPQLKAGEKAYLVKQQKLNSEDEITEEMAKAFLEWKARNGK